MTNEIIKATKDTAWVDISTKTHPDAVMIIDLPDLIKIVDDIGSVWPKAGAYTVYAECRFGKRTRPVHQLVMGDDDGVIDHINRNGLDNRSANLRLVTASENIINRRTQKNNKSGAVGVHWRNDRKRWVAVISKDKKAKTIGYYKTFEDAVSARLCEQEKMGFFCHQEV